MSSSDISVSVLNGLGDVVKHNINNINVMMKQLSSNFSKINPNDIERILEQQDFFLAAAMISIRNPPEIVGLGSIFFRETMMGYRGFIEDVVVRNEFRKAGIATEIGQFLIKIAVDKKVSAVHLTSGNHRTAAHRLWLSLGFEIKDSSTFILKLN